MIKVLLVDDHEMVRLGVSAYLSVQEDIEVIAQAENGKIGVEKALELKPDIILMDLVMPVMDGIEATKEILSKWKEAKIIIVTSFIDDEKVYPAITAGAKSYLLKTSSASEIAQAIRDTYRGEGVFEKEVLLLIAQGKSNQEIADECFITLKTVKTHVSNILSKLQVEDRTQATIYAFKHHLVQP